MVNYRDENMKWF